MTTDEMRARLASALARASLLRGHVRGHLVTGLVLVIPLAVTILIIRFIWEFLYNFLLPLFNLVEGQVSFLAGIYVQIIIVSIIVGFLYALGWGARTVAGAQAVRYWHATIESIPFVRGFYRVVRQLVDMFSSDNSLAGKPVVVLEYPRLGTLALGMITSRFFMDDGEEYLTVYVPTIPVPTSGYMAIVKEDQVTQTDISFDEAMRIILSGGALSEEITRRHLRRRQRRERARQQREGQALHVDGHGPDEVQPETLEPEGAAAD